MIYDEATVSLLQERYEQVRPDIIQRLSDFRSIWEEEDEERAMFELLFCILTPQSKAQVCWGAIEEMSCTDTLLTGDYDKVLAAVGMVRFKYRKAGYLIGARERFIGKEGIRLLSFIKEFENAHKARRWFVANIKGLGMKESSHFLRNIGLGDDIAILDRHILRNLVKASVIPRIPVSLTDKRYLEIERLMTTFSDNINIPLPHLDLVIWHIATGSIFK